MIIGVASEDQHIDDRELVDKAMSLKLLPYACTDGGDWFRDGVHSLDLGGLDKLLVSTRLAPGKRGVPRRFEYPELRTYRTEPASVGRQHPPLRFGRIGRCCPLVLV